MSDTTPIETADGSLTCWHPEYREHYHSRDGARSEAESKFIQPSNLQERLQQGPVNLLDIGFGLGGNAFAAIRCAMNTGKHPLRIHSVEHDEHALKRAFQCAEKEERDWIDSLKQTNTLSLPGVELTLHQLDLRKSLKLFPPQRFDLFFHDPFSPMKNPEGWTVELFSSLRALAASDARLLTYSQAWAIRSGLQLAGWHVAESETGDAHRQGTVASTLPLGAPVNIPEGVKAIPYRDPEFIDAPADILRRRQDEIEAFRKNHKTA